MVKGPLKALTYIVSAVLIFLGIIFIISANLGITYFLEGIVFLIIAGAILVFTRERKPIEIRQTISMTGPVKTKEVRCPNCNAIVDPTKATVVLGKPYVTCSYCGNKFELTEEPTW
jgi:DNA-directed RNA polymerase subunit RPC12/RpoP